MLSYDTMGSCVLVLTLATMLIAVLLLVQQRTGKTIAIWFMSGLIGIVLGASGYVAAIQILGMEIVTVTPTGEYMAAEDMGISPSSLDDEDDADVEDDFEAADETDTEPDASQDEAPPTDNE